MSPKTPAACYRCKRQGHTVKQCKFPRAKKTSSLKTGPLRSELESSQMSTLPKPMLKQIVKQSPPTTTPELTQIIVPVPPPARTYSQVVKGLPTPAPTTLTPSLMVGSSGSDSKESQVLTPAELELKNFNNRWETVHFIFRGYNETPCKIKRQNPKYYNTFFICSQYDHHSHSFCRFCKTATTQFWPTSSTPCECLKGPAF